MGRKAIFLSFDGQLLKRTYKYQFRLDSESIQFWLWLSQLSQGRLHRESH